MKWSEQVAYLGDTRNAYKVFVEEARRKVATVKNLHIVNIIILKWILEKLDVVVWTAFFYLRLL
jgi:hypothetical protein